MFQRDEFERTKRENAGRQAEDETLRRLAHEFITLSDKYGYGYQWTWLGLPVIQMPQDIVAAQEVIWRCKPTLIIETGIAWGGSVVLYASILELIGEGRVIAVDKTLPRHNIDAITAYPFAARMTLIEGSSIEPAIVAQIRSAMRPGDRVMVLLDSNHSHDHVLAELRLYGPLVTPGQYLVVSDTIVEDIPEQTHRPRPWGPGNNPATALRAYLAETARFEPDAHLNAKLSLTYSPGGYLVCKG
jgi:cephalosporin hydroxylase